MFISRLILIFPLLLSGCVWVTQYHPISMNDKWDSNKNALIIGACTQSGNKGFAKSSYCRIKNSKGNGVVQIGANGPFGGDYIEINEGNLQKTLFLISVPAGKWSFKEWGVSNYPYWFKYSLEEKKQHSNEINLNNGDIAYFGDIELHLLYGKSGVAGARPVVKDNYEQDIKSILKKYPFMKNKNIDKKLIEITL